MQESVRAVHRHKRTWENIRSPEGAKKYVSKYCLKPYQKKAPRWLVWTGRFWGSDRETGDVPWDEFETIPATEENIRDYLRVLDHPAKDFDILPKYLFNFDV
jgi:hypothetical protein